MMHKFLSMKFTDVMLCKLCARGAMQEHSLCDQLAFKIVLVATFIIRVRASKLQTCTPFTILVIL